MHLHIYLFPYLRLLIHYHPWHPGKLDLSGPRWCTIFSREIIFNTQQRAELLWTTTKEYRSTISQCWYVLIWLLDEDHCHCLLETTLSNLFLFSHSLQSLLKTSAVRLYRALCGPIGWRYVGSYEFLELPGMPPRHKNSLSSSPPLSLSLSLSLSP